MKQTKEEKKEYRKKYTKKYRKKNKAMLKNKAKEWYQKNKQRMKVKERKDNLKKNFDITIEEYNNLFKKQGGTCSICRKKENGKLLAVDHNHKTGEIRGLFCMKCNTALGRFNDDLSLFKKAMEYLEKGEVLK